MSSIVLTCSALGLACRVGSRVPMLSLAGEPFVGGRVRIGGAIVVSGQSTGDVIEMSASVASPTDVRNEQQHAVVRAAPLAVRPWTGRSALSAATTTARPHIATAGARRTRVSEMRLHAPHPRERMGLG
jgi:hypothetical protein